MWARDYCKENGHKDLRREADIIGEMRRPSGWGHRRFLRAIRNNFFLLWHNNRVPMPNGFDAWPVHNETIQEYLSTEEGTSWRRKYRPCWLAPVSQVSGAGEPLLIYLRADEVAELERMAQVLGVDGIGGAGLATIWIKERLVAIRRPFPTVDRN